MNVPSMVYPLALAAVVWVALLFVGFLDARRFDRREAALHGDSVGQQSEQQQQIEMAEMVKQSLEAAITEVDALRERMTASVEALRETEHAN